MTPPFFVENARWSSPTMIALRVRITQEHRIVVHPSLACTEDQQQQAVRLASTIRIARILVNNIARFGARLKLKPLDYLAHPSASVVTQAFATRSQEVGHSCNESPLNALCERSEVTPSELDIRWHGHCEEFNLRSRGRYQGNHQYRHPDHCRPQHHDHCSRVEKWS